MPNSTLKALVQRFARRTGIKVPSVVASSLDPQVMQIQGLLEEEVEELCERSVPLQVMVKEFTFNLLAQEDQGSLETVCGEPVRNMLNNVLWNRTTQQPVLGPVSPELWQQYKSFLRTGPIPEYRIMGDRLLLIPTPTAGHVLGGEFVRRYNVVATSETAPTKEFYTADTDFSVFPDQVLMAGLRWRWKREKGLTYAEDMRRYETIVGGYRLKEATGKTLSLDGSSTNKGIIKPFVTIPNMNWPV